jgi:hypothetical protein
LHEGCFVISVNPKDGAELVVASTVREFERDLGFAALVSGQISKR